MGTCLSPSLIIHHLFGSCYEVEADLSNTSLYCLSELLSLENEWSSNEEWDEFGSKFVSKFGSKIGRNSCIMDSRVPQVC